MARIAALFLVLIGFASLAAGCGSGESQEEIATGVARAWVDESIEEVSHAVIELVAVEASVVTQMVGEVLAEQVRSNLDWTYSAPRRDSEARYQMTATAAVRVTIEIPLLEDKTYAVFLPFSLEIDTDARRVVRWSPDILSATVEVES